MRRIIAWIVGESSCPACGGGLELTEAGHHACTNCDAVVDYERGGWMFAGGTEMRRLPGLLGRPWDRERKAA